MLMNGKSCLILDKPIETPSEELFVELKWMTFPERVMYQKAILMYKIMHNLTPAYLTNMFTFSKEVHDRTLRSTADNLLYIPKPNIEHYRNSLAYSGSKIWNSIPNPEMQSPFNNLGKDILTGQPHKNILYFRNRTLFAFVYVNFLCCIYLYVYVVLIYVVLIEDLREDWTCPTEPPL